MTAQVSILGERWTVKEGTEEEYPGLAGVDGYTDSSCRTIIIDSTVDDQDPLAKQELGEYRKVVIRHEVLHAFLFESGLDSCTSRAKNWSMNEEMVDWFAIQFPKILEAYKALGVA